MVRDMRLLVILPLVLAVLTLSGCGAPDPDPDSGQVRPVGSAVVPPAFGDADPTNWSGRTPSSYPVHGIDVARYQTSIDWRAARAAGVNFAFIKATEGVDNIDPAFRQHWNGAGRAGVRRGAYHFFYHCAPAADQARSFIRTVPRAAGALPPVLDMEWTPFSPTCTVRRDGATIRAEVQRYVQVVTAHYGQRPIIYTSIDFYRDTDLGKVDGVDFWLRAVAQHPSTAYPGQRWAFWQYSSTGLVPGIAGNTDLNVFAGSRADWAEWLAQ